MARGSRVLTHLAAKSYQNPKTDIAGPHSSGCMGIKLQATTKVVLSATATGTNPFEDPNFDTAVGFP